jgi:hypothetical protein
MIGIIYVQNVHDHPIDNLILAIRLGVECRKFGELGVQL